MSDTPAPTGSASSFGANQWLVDELYEQYQQDRNSVDPSWWDFFAQYHPEGASSGQGAAVAPAPAAAPRATPTPQATPAAPAAPPASAVPTAQAAPAASAALAPTPATPVTPPSAPTGAAATPAQAPAAPVAADVPSKSAQESTAVSGPTPREGRAPVVQAPAEGDAHTPIRGVAARIVANMDASVAVPTATSFRGIPAKAIIDNRILINEHLKRNRGGKVSFTHLIGFAVVRALSQLPDMNRSFALDDAGKPVLVDPAHVNFGIAIDLPKPDGSRSLVVPSVKRAQAMDFFQFWNAYEDLVKKARAGTLTVEDFSGTTITLTNPGGIGTLQSVPRLMPGQGTIIGVGAMEYPAEWQGANEETIHRHGISKLITMSSTYDHRIIQGATSGEFLRIIQELLMGEGGFYDEVFRSLRIPYEPVRWERDLAANHEADLSKAARVQQLIHAYRVRGHLLADIDPLEYRMRYHEDLDLKTYGLTLWDLDRDVATGGFGGKERATLREILDILRDSYCRTMGVEYMHIQERDQRVWMQSKVEVKAQKTDHDEQLRILRRLNAAEAFETFLQTKYVGQKRFSLEGGETAIALLDKILCRAAEDGLDEVCIGMPHRGRLNVLANIAGKSYAQIFREFDDQQDPRTVQGSGDVKYHLGTEGVFTAEDGATTKVYLAANPSHLEAVNPVLEGIVRAKQDRIDRQGNQDGTNFPVLPILLHGDASFAGQGINLETLQLSQLAAYRTGGTIHLVVNNQVGFTTAPSKSRSSVYCTDLARTVQAPIFHVNGDDPEACVRVAELAYEFREAFHEDVVIDMVCYRRRGHNEGDDPSMTQPVMYKLIDAKRSVRKLYTEALVGRGDITMEDAQTALADYQGRLEQVFVETREAQRAQARGEGDMDGLERPEAQVADEAQAHRSHATAISKELIERIGDAFSAYPQGFAVHKKLQQMLEKRTEMTRQGGIDWGTAELLAFGSLSVEGTPVRLSGQDCRRGTFVQRHAVLIDRDNASDWTPLHFIQEGQAPIEVYDSLLSEYAVMGFEYGYSVERPEALVLWEGQFGDFANGAQTIIDEFISSSEQKWNQRSSVVLMLPHGYEGQGPDHSSARIERYLQLCAQDNMTVCYPSTPASHFHMLRRQAYARPRKPLIAFTPKQLLRLKAATSSVEDFTHGSFQPVIRDHAALDDHAVSRVILASARVVYDLEAERESRQDRSTAIVRVEQLYPIPAAEIASALSAYPSAEVVWVQDEPENQGAWPFMALNLPALLAKHGEHRQMRLVSRAASAAPSTGSHHQHDVERDDILARAFDR